MKTVRFALTLSLAAGALASVQAQAVVDATGTTPGSFTTIGAALAGTDAEIIVKNTGVYDEAFLITRDVILRGEDPNNRPVIALQALAEEPATGGSGDGIYIGGSPTGSGNLNVTFKDFILVPSLSNPFTDDGVSMASNTDGILTITMENILGAPNDGSNAPEVTSIWDDPVNTGAASSWVYSMTNTQFLGLEGSIVTTLTDCTFIKSGGDSVVFYPGPAGSLTASGVGTSFAGRYALQYSNQAPITITGTKENPGWVARKNANGLIIFQGTAFNATQIVSVDNNNVGIRADADTVGTVNISDSLFANNATQGIYTPYVAGEAKNWTIDNCTFHNNGTNTGAGVFSNIQIRGDIDTDDPTPLLTLNVTDSVFTGPSAPGIDNFGGAVVNVSNSALVTAGPNALPSATIDGPVTLSEVINDDPAYASTATTPVVEDSFDVTAAAYATASSTDGPLNGWGEGPSSSVNEWTLY